MLVKLSMVIIIGFGLNKNKAQFAEVVLSLRLKLHLGNKFTDVFTITLSKCHLLIVTIITMIILFACGCGKAMAKTGKYTL